MLYKNLFKWIYIRIVYINTTTKNSCQESITTDVKDEAILTITIVPV